MQVKSCNGYVLFICFQNVAFASPAYSYIWHNDPSRVTDYSTAMLGEEGPGCPPTAC